jgi:hypothetical protein
MRVVYIVEIHITVNNIKILNVAQKCFYDDKMSPAIVNIT